MYAPRNLPDSSMSKKYLKYDRPILSHSLDGHFLLVVLANAVGHLGGDHEANRVLHLGPVHKESLAANSDW